MELRGIRRVLAIAYTFFKRLLKTKAYIAYLVIKIIKRGISSYIINLLKVVIFENK